MPNQATNTPRVSIGLPVYNGSRFLRAAMDSLLGQTFTDFELIVSDNASSDDSAAIVQEYMQHDARIVFVRQPTNLGAARNFNYVAEHARGEYFKWAASDDVCAPTFLARCVEVLDADPTVICCHTRTRKIDEHGESLMDLDDPTDGGLPTAWFLNARNGHRRPDASSPYPSRRFADVLLFSGWAARSYCVFRTVELRKTSLLLPYYGSEKTTMAELALRGRFHDVPETLFFQRVHDGASSRLKTSAGQQQYIAGRPTGRQSPRLQLVRDYLRAISASPISVSEKCRCYAWLVRYFLQMHKWPHVLFAAVSGRGIGSEVKHTRALRKPATSPAAATTWE